MAKCSDGSLDVFMSMGEGHVLSVYQFSSFCAKTSNYDSSLKLRVSLLIFVRSVHRIFSFLQVQCNLFKTKLSYMAMLHMDDDMMDDEPRLVFFPTVEREDRDYYRPTGDPLGHTYEKRTPRFYGVRCGDEGVLPDEMVGEHDWSLLKEFLFKQFLSFMWRQKFEWESTLN